MAEEGDRGKVRNDMGQQRPTFHRLDRAVPAGGGRERPEGSPSMMLPLPPGWLCLQDCNLSGQLNQPVVVPFVLIHPDVGVALIDIAPASNPEAELHPAPAAGNGALRQHLPGLSADPAPAAGSRRLAFHRIDPARRLRIQAANLGPRRRWLGERGAPCPAARATRVAPLRIPAACSPRICSAHPDPSDRPPGAPRRDRTCFVER